VKLLPDGSFANVPFGMRGLLKAITGVTAPSLVWVVISARGYITSGPWAIPQNVLRTSKVELPPIELLADVPTSPWRVRGQLVSIETLMPISANLSVSRGTGPAGAFDVLPRKMVMAVGTFDFSSPLPPPYSFHASSTQYPGFYTLALNRLLYYHGDRKANIDYLPVERQVQEIAAFGVDVMIPLVPLLPNGQIRLVLTWNAAWMVGLGLHTSFKMSTGAVCHVGPLAAECGGAAHVMQMERPGVLGVQSILLSTVKQTKYLVWVRYRLCDPWLCPVSLRGVLCLCSAPATRGAPLWALSAQVSAYSAPGEMLSVNTVFQQDRLGNATFFYAMCIDTKRDGYIQVGSQPSQHVLASAFTRATLVNAPRQYTFAFTFVCQADPIARLSPNADLSSC
jgi:hypothetical protein